MHFMKIQLDCFNCFKLFPRDRGEVMDGFGITFGLKLDRCKKNKMCIILTQLESKVFFQVYGMDRNYISNRINI